MESEYRKENMISYHKGYMMIPLMFGGFTASLFTVAESKKYSALEKERMKIKLRNQQKSLDEEANKYKYKRSNKELVAILQRNLANIRIIAGLNADYYAKNMEVSRQAISQIENGKVKMSKQSGLAWTTVVQIMANQFPDNLPLQKVCNLLLYGLNDYSNEELKEYEETIDRIVKAKKAGLDDKTLELLASNLPDIKVK